MTNRMTPFAALAAASMITPAWAQEADTGWEYTVSPYLWAAGINGSTSLPRFPPLSLDLGFDDILDNLDMAAFVVGEARQDGISFSVGIAYVALSTSVDVTGVVPADSVGVTSTSFMGTILGGYEYISNETTRVDLVGGARIWDVDTKLKPQGGALDGTSAGGGDVWVDPMLGLKFRHEVNENLYVAGWGLVGGFGLASNHVVDVMAGVGYEFENNISVFGGYRAMSVDYTERGFVWDVVQQGPVLSAVFKF